MAKGERTLARPCKVSNAMLLSLGFRLPAGPEELLKVLEELQAECCWLTWEGLQALQEGGHSHLLLQGGVAEVLVVQEVEQPCELREQLLQH